MNTATNMEKAADQFGHNVAARLNEGHAHLSYVVVERLRASREQALSLRKRPVTVTSPSLQTATQSEVYLGTDGSATLGGLGGGISWMPHWLRTALIALPILASVAAIGVASVDQDNVSPMEVAELDTELLTAPLPPDAYTDPGFIQYLESQQEAPSLSPQ